MNKAIYGIFIILGIIGISLVIVGCSKSTDNTQLPNPASKNCVDKGYKLEIRTAADGSQTGYCIDNSTGKECEEWALYRGECKFG